MVGAAGIDPLDFPCSLFPGYIEPESDTGSGRVRAGSDEDTEDMRIVPENPVAETSNPDFDNASPYSSVS